VTRIAIRNQLITQLEEANAEYAAGARHPMLTFVVAGGGFAGLSHRAIMVVRLAYGVSMPASVAEIESPDPALLETDRPAEHPPGTKISTWPSVAFYLRP